MEFARRCRLLLCFLAVSVFFCMIPASAVDLPLDCDILERLDALAEEAMAKSGTPGIAAAIVTPETVDSEITVCQTSKGRGGYERDLFELGSMSKAYTALGILYLEQQGMLSLSDEVQKWIPELTVYYKGRVKGEIFDGEVPLTIDQCLHHTTGIPFRTIGYIPEGDTPDMLDKTVEMLSGVRLDFYPGEKFSYTTVNYDILGCIIQRITGESFETFITEQILRPLGLYKTYLTRQAAAAVGPLAQGYKVDSYRRCHMMPLCTAATRLRGM